MPSLEKTPSKILIIIIKGIGDVILTEPCAQVVKHNYPKAQLDFLVNKDGAPVLANNPYIDHVITYDRKHPVKELFRIRARKYDWVVDLSVNNPRPAMITAFCGAPVRAGARRCGHSFYAYNVKFPNNHLYESDYKLACLKHLGLTWPDEHAPLAKYYMTPQEMAFRDQTYNDLGVKDGEMIMGFYPTPRYETRRWPAGQYRETAKLLYEKYKARIFVFYGPGEEDLAKAVTHDMPSYIQLAPAAKNLGDVMALLSRLSIFIASCGGTKHMALAAGVPTVTVHTVNHADVWTPLFDPKHRAVSADVPCSPCFRGKIGCDKNLECMSNVTPQAVFEEAKKILG
ncbi:MAG: glycosyltransferase family 9 protein [Phycisphaerae bacterium]|nr:glycosyltransferase family 9 protein [Phycisphaerae bacterium]